MKAHRVFGLALSWPRVTAVLLIDIALLAAASHWPADWQSDHFAWWVGVALALIVTIVALVTYRQITLASALATRVRDQFLDPDTALVEGRTPPFDHRRHLGREVVGIREYQGRLIAAIIVESVLDASSGRHRYRDHDPSSDALPVDVVAEALRQFDVRLDGIDIISVQGRQAGDAYGAVADERHTWLVLRMDPQRNVAAVAARDSAESTLAAVVERLAYNLDGSRWAARPLTAEELSDMDAAILAGLEPQHVRMRRRRLKQGDGSGAQKYATSFWVSPYDITSDTLDRLWLADTGATVVTVRLVARRGGADVSAWVRYHSDEPLSRDVSSGLNRLTGRQLAAVSASLPVPVARSPLVLPARALDDGERLTVTTGRVAELSPSLVESHR